MAKQKYSAAERYKYKSESAYIAVHQQVCETCGCLHEAAAVVLSPGFEEIQPDGTGIAMPYWGMLVSVSAEGTDNRLVTEFLCAISTSIVDEGMLSNACPSCGNVSSQDHFDESPATGAVEQIDARLIDYWYLGEVEVTGRANQANWVEEIL